MRFYRVERMELGQSHGASWTTVKREAKQTAAKWRRSGEEHDAKVEPVDIAPNKAGILRALRFYASHPDNG